MRLEVYIDNHVSTLVGKGGVMYKKKVMLSNLSSNGERKKRTILALKEDTKIIDKKAYNKKYQAKVKKARDYWKEWF